MECGHFLSDFSNFLPEFINNSACGYSFGIHLFKKTSPSWAVGTFLLLVCHADFIVGPKCQCLL